MLLLIIEELSAAVGRLLTAEALVIVHVGDVEDRPVGC